MATTLSVKHVPDDVAERLKERARRHHRSLQGELRAILDEAVASVVVGHASRASESAPAYVVSSIRTTTVDDLFPGRSVAGQSDVRGIGSEDAAEMLSIVEREFERVDPDEWA